MPLYISTFERINFGLRPALRQTADVLLRTDIPYEDETLDAFESALWAAMWVQNPHWRDPAGPLGVPSGWSSVMGGSSVQLVNETKNLCVAWHRPLQGWLCTDEINVTVDVDDAGRFTPEQMVALLAKYPGEQFPLVSAKLLSEIYCEDGSPLAGVRLQLVYDEFVLWGAGPRENECFHEVSRAETRSGRLTWKFSLPEDTAYRPAPQEYARVKSWAWRMLYGNDCAGQEWTLAVSQEAALASARDNAVSLMRSNGSHECGAYLATKHKIEVQDCRDSAATT